MRSDIVVMGGGAIGAAVAYFVRLLFSLPENIELSKYSIGFFEDFADTMAVDGEPADIGLKKNGYLFIVPPAQRDVLRSNFDTQRSLGCNVEWLERDALKGRFPSMNVDDLGAAVL